MLARLWSHRDLVTSLVRRQFQLRYRQSAAGFVWAILPPLVTVGAATLVFDRVAGVKTGNVPYPLFAFAALVPWSFFSASLTSGIPSIITAQQMISRIAFPRAALPLSVVGLSLLDLVIAGAIFVVFTYLTGSRLTISALWFPIPLIVEMVLVIGVVLLLSAMNVFTRDVRIVVPFVTQLWLFLTPVFYPLSAVPPDVRDWYLLNPMTGVVATFRDVLIRGTNPDPVVLLPAIVGAVAFFVVGSWYFASTERRFADVI